MNIRRPRLPRDSVEALDGEPVTLESAAIEGDRASLELSFGRGFWERLETFLKEKQLKTDEGIALLLEYGAPKEDTARPMPTAEKFAMGGRHSSLHFKTFECFQENKAIATGLSAHFAENRRLKRRLAELKGEMSVPRDEWDAWDKATIEEYQRKYLFGR